LPKRIRAPFPLSCFVSAPLVSPFGDFSPRWLLGIGVFCGYMRGCPSLSSPKSHASPAITQAGLLLLAIPPCLFLFLSSLGLFLLLLVWFRASPRPSGSRSWFFYLAPLSSRESLPGVRAPKVFNSSCPIRAAYPSYLGLLCYTPLLDWEVLFVFDKVGTSFFFICPWRGLVDCPSGCSAYPRLIRNPSQVSFFTLSSFLLTP